MSPINRLVVLFGVKGSRRTLDLAQVPTDIHNNDRAFFFELRKRYRNLRGFWRYWFSVWQLRHCDFVKFEKYRENRIVSRGQSLPDDILYDYAPRPAQEMPPISQHEFEMALHPCLGPCPFALLPSHDCIELPETNSSALEKIPKRKSEFLLEVKNREFAWGIEACYSMSFVHMTFYHLFIFAGTFGFWIWWLKFHPDDLQNAAVPLTTVAIFLSLFWGMVGVFKVFRDPESVDLKVL